jgi:hypothetical protein
MNADALRGQVPAVIGVLVRRGTDFDAAEGTCTSARR